MHDELYKIQFFLKNNNELILSIKYYVYAIKHLKSQSTPITES